ncbi:MAG: helix-turn-helix transcriptional regulator [Pseudomonadota bacterium]
MSRRQDPMESEDTKSLMSAEQFRSWRKTLGLKQKDAANLLGLQKRMIQYYEKGHRDGKPVVIPKSVRLACYALEQGVDDYNGRETTRIDIGRYRRASGLDG